MINCPQCNKNGLEMMPGSIEEFSKTKVMLDFTLYCSQPNCDYIKNVFKLMKKKELEK